jgi:hypothetical protein
MISTSRIFNTFGVTNCESTKCQMSLTCFSEVAEQFAIQYSAKSSRRYRHLFVILGHFFARFSPDLLMRSHNFVIRGRNNEDTHFGGSS